jgi:enhancing lycopene biosynthesis protein 2
LITDQVSDETKKIIAATASALMADINSGKTDIDKLCRKNLKQIRKKK